MFKNDEFFIYFKTFFFYFDPMSYAGVSTAAAENVLSSNHTIEDTSKRLQTYAAVFV